MPSVQAGTILIEDQPLMAHVLGLGCEPYFGDWGVPKGLDSFTLDRKIHAAGWNFFFMAAEVKAMFFGALNAENIQKALKRIVAKVRPENYNAVEITSIVGTHFLGVPYTVVSAHSRHIQQSGELDCAEGRRAAQRDAEWAKG